MSQVIISSNAIKNLERLREFLRPKNPEAATRASHAIVNAIQILAQHPQIGRPVERTSGKMRELSIPFGKKGYVARYIYEGMDVEIVAIRHMREAGFQIED